MHQHCTYHAILMPFQFPRIQNTINKPQSLTAGLAAQELCEATHVSSPAWDRSQHTGEMEHSHPHGVSSGPCRCHIPATLTMELLIVAEINCTQAEP